MGRLGTGPYPPSTRLIHCRVQLEGLLKIVETDHLLIQCVHLNAAQVARESEGLRGLWGESMVRAPSRLLETERDGLFPRLTGRAASTLHLPEAEPGPP